jgi:hypothetical protein
VALKGRIETEQFGALTLQPVIAFNVPAVSSNVVTIRPEGALLQTERADPNGRIPPPMP